MPSVCHKVFFRTPALLLHVASSFFANFCLNLGWEDAALRIVGLCLRKSPLNPQGYIRIIALTMTAGSALLSK